MRLKTRVDEHIDIERFFDKTKGEIAPPPPTLRRFEGRKDEFETFPHDLIDVTLTKDFRAKTFATSVATDPDVAVTITHTLTLKKNAVDVATLTFTTNGGGMGRSASTSIDIEYKAGDVLTVTGTLTPGVAGVQYAIVEGFE